MADWETLEQLKLTDSVALDPRADYRWTGIKVQAGLKPAKRVIEGTYDGWFQWYMRYQRFKAFRTLVLVNPLTGVSHPEWGGYIDGLLARLMGKVRQVVIISQVVADPLPSKEEQRTKEVIRALLYGTRLTRPEVLRQLRLTLTPIDEETLGGVFTRYSWLISQNHPRYALEEEDEELLQAMIGWYPRGYIEGRDHVEQLFRRERRFRPELKLPNELIATKALEDADRFTWVTVPFETQRLSTWLQQLNRLQDDRLAGMWHEDVSKEQWLRLLSPTRRRVREVLKALSDKGKLERLAWFREVGRPAAAYVLPKKRPFLEWRCGRCAFYIPSRRRCSLWWLANKRTPFYYPLWKQSGSQVSRFEIHKMTYASRIGPHSSACARFLDKKRDHLRKAVPEKCEVCGWGVPPITADASICPNCKTKYAYVYVKDRRKVKVMTAYEHVFGRIYREATGGDARADLEAWKENVRKDMQLRNIKPEPEDFGDVLADEGVEPGQEPPRTWPAYSQALQEKVDKMAQFTDVSARLSLAMAQSAHNATRRILTFERIPSHEADPLLSRLGQYLALIKDAPPTRLLPYEALIMRQYWRSYRFALRFSELWSGPRKRSRFVAEFVENPAARARGYSPIDAAINHLHQRRLRQAERINQETGYPGTCDGFLHRERYNSRKIGLLLDMVDPFKFADREELLMVVLGGGLTWKDFGVMVDRRSVSFYYPLPSAVAKLNQAGSDADGLVVQYQGVSQSLSDAYRAFAASVLQAIMAYGEGPMFDSFVYAPA